MLQVKCKEILTKMQMQGNTNEIEKANANASVNAINESIFIFYYMRLRLLLTRVKLNCFRPNLFIRLFKLLAVSFELFHCNVIKK